MTPITFQLQLSPEQAAQFEKAMRLTPTEIDAIAKATVEHLRGQAMQPMATMTLPEFAVKARVSVKHVYRLIQQGRLEAMRPAGGGDRRITAAAAAKYFAGEGNGAAE